MSENNAGNQPLLLILAIFIPPAAAWLVSEGNPKQMLRTIVALVGCCIFGIPGILYALDLVLDKKNHLPRHRQSGRQIISAAALH